jgi:CheY-like chemotaxis protein
MPGGGELTIRTAAATYPSENPADRTSHEPYACLSVIDTGTGIDAAIRTRIFEPFFTTKSIGKGSGLGLAMVYGFVKQSGGHIDVETEAMRGSTFRLYLPFVAGGAVESALPDPFFVGRGRGERILLVEDDLDVSRVAEQSLLRQGYSVRVFNDPLQAIDYAANPQSSIDLLLTDVVMPQMNGNEMAQRIVRTRPGLKVLYMSGHTRDVKIAGIRNEQLLEKPFTPDSLARRVRLLLDGSNSS